MGLKQETKIVAILNSCFLRHVEKKRSKRFKRAILQKLRREECTYPGFFFDEMISIQSALRFLMPRSIGGYSARTIEAVTTRRDALKNGDWGRKKIRE